MYVCSSLKIQTQIDVWIESFPAIEIQLIRAELLKSARQGGGLKEEVRVLPAIEHV